MPKIDAGPTIQAMDRLLANVAFGIARGLTKVAQAAAADIKRSLPTTFDRPNPFTLQGVTFSPATKDTLVSTVFVKDQQAAYLEIEETGGIRAPRPGSPINLPVDLRTNAYGNIPRGKIAQLLARKDVFVASGKGRNAALPPGLYQRLPASKRGRGRKRVSRANRKAQLELLVAFEKRAAYKPRFGLETSVAAFVATQGASIVEKSLADAIASAR